MAGGLAVCLLGCLACRLAAWLVVAGGLNVIELSPARAMLAVRRLEEGPAQPVVLTFTRMHLEAHAYKQGQLRVCRHPRAPT